MKKIYWNFKKMIWRKTKSKNTILISENNLRKTITGYFGHEEIKDGCHISTIGNVEFLWVELDKTLINPEHKIKVYNPADPMYYTYILLD